MNSDAEAVRQLFQPKLTLIATLGVVAAIFAAASAALMADLAGFGAGLFAALPFIVIAAFASYLGAQTANTLAARLSAGSVVTVDASGLRSTIPQGLVSLPWHAIESVSMKKKGGHSILTFRISRGTGPDTDGVDSTLSPAAFALLAKRGFQVGSAGVDTPIQTIADATAAFTSGRLQVR
ncbi:MAG: hypothetical protein ABWX56_01070 [Mycetocola sp.]